MTNQVEVSNLITPLIKVFKAINAEWDNYFQNGLSAYLQSQTEKYYFTNTFLHRSEKVKFKDIYYPIEAVYKALVTDFSALEDVFSEYKNITIIGSAGSGKTTLLKHIFLTTIQDRNKIPILVELRNLNDYEGNFEKLITEKILKSKVKPNDITFKRTLESGKFLFLLDGYDEIFSNRKQNINRQIEMFVDSYSENRFLITTRPGSGIENFPRFYDFHVCSLNNVDVEGFINKIVKEGERKDRINNIIKDPKNQNYIEYLRNPLLLSMFIMAFESHPEIPKRKSAFYRNVFDTLYSKHDGITKNSYPREKLTKLERDDFEYILSIFSYLTLSHGRYAFTQEYLSDVLIKVKSSTEYVYNTEELIYDLRTSISILILDGFEYVFPHRSMQEYFTALFISKLPTDKKPKAYNNLSSILKESSYDFSFNFWSLCYELDESIFLSHFLIPELQEIYDKLENKEGKDLLNEFSCINVPLLSPKHDSFTGKDVFMLYRSATFENSILDFCEAFDYFEFWEFPIASGCFDELNKAIVDIKKDSAMDSFDIYYCEQIKDVLIDFNILDLIKKFRNQINNKLIQLKQVINRKETNIDELLNK